MKNSAMVCAGAFVVFYAWMMFGVVGKPTEARADSSEQREMQEELRRSRVALESIAHSLERCK